MPSVGELPLVSLAPSKQIGALAQQISRTFRESPRGPKLGSMNRSKEIRRRVRYILLPLQLYERFSVQLDVDAPRAGFTGILFGLISARVSD